MDLSVNRFNEAWTWPRLLFFGKWKKVASKPGFRPGCEVVKHFTHLEQGLVHLTVIATSNLNAGQQTHLNYTILDTLGESLKFIQIKFRKMI